MTKSYSDYCKARSFMRHRLGCRKETLPPRVHKHAQTYMPSYTFTYICIHVHTYKHTYKHIYMYDMNIHMYKHKRLYRSIGTPKTWTHTYHYVV